MATPPILIRLKRAESEIPIVISICYKNTVDRYYIKFVDPVTNECTVEFTFESDSGVLQYLETFVNLVGMCHEDEIVSLQGIIPGYPVVNIKMNEIKQKYSALSRSIACYLTAVEEN
jgi:hypothetical protein